MTERSGASIVLACTCVLLAFQPEPVAATLAWQREAILDGQWWRLWSGHLVHFGVRHAVVDAAVLLVAGILFERVLGWRRWLAAVALTAPMVSVLLLGVPSLQEYRGASGIGCMLACGALPVLWRAAPRWRKDMLAAGAGFAAFVLLQACGGDIGAAGLPPDVTVAWQAHLAGAACGLVAALHHQLLEYLTSRYESGPGVHRGL